MADTPESIAPAAGAAGEGAVDESVKPDMPDEAIEAPRFRDALFRAKRKKGKFAIVEPPAPALEAPIADTHAHLGLIDAPLALARCAVRGVGFVCCMTDIDEDTYAVYAALDDWIAQAGFEVERLALGDPARRGEPVASGKPATCGSAPVADIPASGAIPPLPDVRLAVGCHPHNAKDYTPDLERHLRDALADPRTCALGEVGLDYFYDFSTPEQQERAFRAQIRLAHETGLPLILHIRDAHAPALVMLEEEGFPEAGTLLHCCSLAADELAPWLAHGCYIAYGGALTFKRSEAARQAAASVPHDKLLTETDAPYMAPEPLRGSECTPDMTIFTAARLAEVLGCPPGPLRADLLAQLYRNARGLLDRRPTAWQLNRS